MKAHGCCVTGIAPALNQTSSACRQDGCTTLAVVITPQASQAVGEQCMCIQKAVLKITKQGQIFIPEYACSVGSTLLAGGFPLQLAVHARQMQKVTEVAGEQ